MTLDEAIKHCEEVAEKNEKLCETIHPSLQWSDYGKCAAEHRQLAEWLKDYKKLLGAIEDIKAEITQPNEMDSLENSNLWQGWFLKLIDKHTSGKEDV